MPAGVPHGAAAAAAGGSCGRPVWGRDVHGDVDSAWRDPVQADDDLPRPADHAGQVSRGRPPFGDDDVGPFGARPATELIRADQPEVEGRLAAVVLEGHLQGTGAGRHLDDEVLIDALGPVAAGVVPRHRAHGSNISRAAAQTEGQARVSGGTSTPQRRIPAAIRSLSRSSTATRAKRFCSAAMRSHGTSS